MIVCVLFNFLLWSRIYNHGYNRVEYFCKVTLLAVRWTLWRTIVVYIRVAIFYGVTIPFDYLNLFASIEILEFPIIIAVLHDVWTGRDNLVSAVFLTGCMCAIGSFYIVSWSRKNYTRELLALMNLVWSDERGIAILAITAFNSLGLISLINMKVVAASACSHTVNLFGVGVFMLWGVISYTHFTVRKT